MVYIRAVATALLSGIIVPLYIYPEEGCTAWEPLFTAISSHSTLPFYVIVNPDSGPGTDPLDPNYQACIPNLRPVSNPNVKVIGYVTTGVPGQSGARLPADVTGDVDTYAGWGVAYRPDGIFFDQASLSTSTNDLTNYEDYSTYVGSKTWHGSGAGFVAFNPGDPPSTSTYFGFADLILTIEDFEVNADTDIARLVINTASPAAKQAVVLHTGPSTPPVDIINELITQDHIGAVYLTDIADDATTDDNPYGAFPTEWVDFVDEVEAAASA